MGNPTFYKAVFHYFLSFSCLTQSSDTEHSVIIGVDDKGDDMSDGEEDEFDEDDEEVSTLFFLFIRGAFSAASRTTEDSL